MAPALVIHDTTLRMVFDYAGVAVFAATGALAAARRGFDIVTFAFFAAVTGIGGGTLRDLLIGAPVFWVLNPGYLGVCIAAAGAVWAVGDRLQRLRTLLWLDALGLAAYCVIGASKAADWGAPPLVAVVMGVLSASFGGVVRDVLAGEPSALHRKEIYITAAVAGAAAFVLLRLLGLSEPVAGGAGMAAAFALRAGALVRGWSLPGFGPGDQLAAVPAVPVSAPAPVAPLVPVPTPPDPVVEDPPEPAPAPKPRRRAPPRPKPSVDGAIPTAAVPPKRPRAPRKPPVPRGDTPAREGPARESPDGEK